MRNDGVQRAMVDEPVSIGVATMTADGVIKLMLRVEGAGIIGDTFSEYGPDHPEYAEILQHIGGLKPGQSKAVPPWKPDNTESPSKIVVSPPTSGEKQQ